MCLRGWMTVCVFKGVGESVWLSGCRVVVVLMVAVIPTCMLNMDSAC